MSASTHNKFTKTGDGVYRAAENITFASREDIDWLKQQAQLTEKKRARICFHRHDDDPVHEMVIAVHKTSFISPHAHPHKEESLHLIEGDCEVLLFSESGELIKTENLKGDGNAKDSSYFYRIARDIIHGLKLNSEWIVFHEVAAGPLRPDANFIPLFVPEFKDAASGIDWVDNLFNKKN